jgi:DNA-binding transcriptional ArsR family regulator
VLEAAGLVERQPDGRMTQCSLEPAGFEHAHAWIERYRRYWEDSLDRLADYLENESPPST